MSDFMAHVKDYYHYDSFVGGKNIYCYAINLGIKTF